MSVSTSPLRKQQTLSRVFVVPIVIGIASSIGLVAALIDDGIWDAIGWLGLTVPLAATVFCLIWRRQRG